MDVMSLASRSRPVLRLLIGSHTRIYRVTSGLIGHRFSGAPPMLLLDHVGAKSGIKRTTPLVYVEDDHDVVIVASKGGHPRNPAWYHNLRANPDTMVQIGAGRRETTAQFRERALLRNGLIHALRLRGDLADRDARIGLMYNAADGRRGAQRRPRRANLEEELAQFAQILRIRKVSHGLTLLLQRIVVSRLGNSDDLQQRVRRFVERKLAADRVLAAEVGGRKFLVDHGYRGRGQVGRLQTASQQYGNFHGFEKGWVDMDQVGAGIGGLRSAARDEHRGAVGVLRHQGHVGCAGGAHAWNLSEAIHQS